MAYEKKKTKMFIAMAFRRHARQPHREAPNRCFQRIYSTPFDLDPIFLSCFKI